MERLPDGFETVLGEGGGLISGGQGQRVRAGRAMLRSGVRLAILDEPARGLDRAHRQRLLERARERWNSSTLLAITHDVAETKVFDRVLVIEGGKILEDGSPCDLYANPASRYRALCDAESEVREHMWQGPRWRRLHMASGSSTEADSPSRDSHPVEPVFSHEREALALMFWPDSQASEMVTHLAQRAGMPVEPAASTNDPAGLRTSHGTRS